MTRETASWRAWVRRTVRQRVAELGVRGAAADLGLRPLEVSRLVARYHRVDDALMLRAGGRLIICRAELLRARRRVA